MENLEIRVESTGKGWKVERREIGALVRTDEFRSGSHPAAVRFGQRLAAKERASGQFGSVRLFLEELF